MYVGGERVVGTKIDKKQIPQYVKENVELKNPHYTKPTSLVGEQLVDTNISDPQRFPQLTLKKKPIVPTKLTLFSKRTAPVNIY